MVDIILGLQWGDEGKGKIVDVFSPHYDIIARFQGGPNAGHTIIFDNQKFVLHTIPSGIFHHDCRNVIGNGVIIDPSILMKEVDKLKEAGVNAIENLFISRRAHLILPSHRLLDTAYECEKGLAKIGSTLKGIGPTYTDKTARNGLRIGDISSAGFTKKYNALKESHFKILEWMNFNSSLHVIDGISFDEYEAKWMEAVERIKTFKLIDAENFINKSLDEGKSILAEGAQGSLLDVDFGSYPFVTSSNTIAGGACAGLGISPHRIGKIHGIFKAYCTRVGSGPFPTELFDETGESLRKGGKEFGSTTGRPRRCGWLDLPALKYSIMLNGVDSLIMMKADVMDAFEEINVCTSYQTGATTYEGFPFDLDEAGVVPVYETVKGWNSPITGASSFGEIPQELQQYISLIENAVKVPIEIISLGPDRTQTIQKNRL